MSDDLMSLPAADRTKKDAVYRIGKAMYGKASVPTSKPWPGEIPARARDKTGRWIRVRLVPISDTTKQSYLESADESV